MMYVFECYFASLCGNYAYVYLFVLWSEKINYLEDKNLLDQPS